MQAKVQEHKKQLEEYEYHSNLYGKQAQNLQAHCRGLIRYYEQAEKQTGRWLKSTVNWLRKRKWLQSGRVSEANPKATDHF